MEEIERVNEPKATDNCKEILSSPHIRAIVHMNNHSMDRGNRHRVSVAKDILAIDSFLEKQSQFVLRLLFHIT